MMRRIIPWLWLWLWVSAASGCVGDTSDPLPLATPERMAFDTQVWPILVRDCGFSTCHGDSARFFRVLGPGHERLDPAMRLSAPVTGAELQFSYERARSMIDPADPTTSLLLRKPLAVAAGGAGHEGTDSFGRDVYRRPDDPAYVVLYQWVTAPPAAPLPLAPAMSGGMSGAGAGGPNAPPPTAGENAP